MKDYLVIYADDDGEKHPYYYTADIVEAENIDDAVGKGYDLYHELREKNRIPICGFEVIGKGCSDWENVQNLYERLKAKKSKEN